MNFTSEQGLLIRAAKDFLAYAQPFLHHVSAGYNISVPCTTLHFLSSLFPADTATK